MAAINVASVFVYVVGLLSPLTPSEGLPSAWSLLLFVGIPFSLLLLAFRICANFPARLFFGAQLLLILTFSGWLLALQSGVLS